MQDRNTILQTLVRILNEETATEITGVTETTCLRTGLSLDSVDFVGVIMRVEGEYRIRLNQEELAAASTVGDLVTIVAEKTGTNRAAA